MVQPTNTRVVTEADLPLLVTPTSIGLGQVDNTSDEDKDPSLATRLQLASKRNRVLAKKVITGNYTLLTEDAVGDVVLHCTNSAGITITLPQDSAADIPQELAFTIRQFGTGTVTLAAGTGATLVIAAATSGRYTEMTVRKVAPSTWMPSGSLTTSGTPVAAPGVPSSVTGSALNGGATLSWAAPVSNGGSPVTSYVVTLNGAATTVPASTLAKTWPGLTNGTTYTLTVAAVNTVGTGTAVSVTVTPTAGGSTPSSGSGFSDQILADTTLLRYFPMNDKYQGLDLTSGVGLTNTGGGVSFTPAGAVAQGRASDYLTAPSSTDFSVRKPENSFCMFAAVTFPTYTQPQQFHWMSKGGDQPDNYEWAMRLYGDSDTARARNLSNYYWNPNPSYDINGADVPSRRGSGAYMAPPAASPDFGGTERHNGPVHSGEIGTEHWLGIEFTYAANYAGRARFWYGDQYNAMTLLSDRAMNADALVTPVFGNGRLFVFKRGDSDGMVKATIRRLAFFNATKTQTQWRALINPTTMALPEG